VDGVVDTVGDTAADVVPSDVASDVPILTDIQSEEVTGTDVLPADLPDADILSDLGPDEGPDTFQEKMDQLFEGIRPECRPKDLGCQLDSECTDGKKCIGTRCVASAPTAQYAFGGDAFAVVGLAIPSAGAGSGVDLNGDGKPDNLLAETIATYSGGTELVNRTMQQFVDAGALGMVFELKNVPSDGCGPIEIAIHRATSDLDGDGLPDGSAFAVRPDSFRSDGFGPSCQFNTGAMDSGKMASGEGVAIPLHIVLPDGSALDLPLEGARIQATLDVAPTGKMVLRTLNLADPAAPASTNAVLAGFIRISRYSESMNKSSKGCVCAGVNPDVPVSSVKVVSDALLAECIPGLDSNPCIMDTDGRVCVNLGGSCTALWVMGGIADVATGDTVDSQGDPIKDAISMAMYVTMDAATFAEPPLAPEFKAVGDIYKTQNDCDMIRSNVKRRIGVLANDFYDSSLSNVIQSVTQGQYGIVDIGATGDYVYYTPVVNYAGFDRFTYTIQDGKGGTSSANVDVRMSPMDRCQAGWTVAQYCTASCEQDRICDPDGHQNTCPADCLAQYGSVWNSGNECSTARRDRACCRLSIPCAQWIEFKQGEAAVQAGKPPYAMVCKSQIEDNFSTCGSCAPGTWGTQCNQCPMNADGVCGGIGSCNDGLTGDGTCACPPDTTWDEVLGTCKSTNPCALDRCQGVIGATSGSCTPVGGEDWACTCVGTGSTWDQTDHVCLDACTPNPCTGVANGDGTCAVVVAGYSCGCLGDYDWDSVGKTCNFDACNQDRCAGVSGASAGTCVAVGPTDWSCTCATGTWEQATHVCNAPDACSTNPCTGLANSTGVCSLNGPDYECGCNSTYQWDPVKLTCYKVVECCTSTTCAGGGTCIYTGTETPVSVGSDSFTSNADGNWTLSGSATFDTAVGMLKLTDDTTDQAGCAWYNGSAVYACQLKVGFTMKISGTASNAADGIAFVLQPSPLVNAACGGVGGDVGVGGIPGVSVRFQHLKGVFTNVGFWENATNTQRCTGTSVPVFQVDHAYAVEVNVLAGRVIVNIDGTKYLDCDASQWLPTGNLIYGFTAATGAQQAAHFIDDLVATGALLLGGTGFGAQCSAP
jgi:hypothetical protein